ERAPGLYCAWTRERRIDRTAALQARALGADIRDLSRKLAGQLALKSKVPLLRVTEVLGMRIMREQGRELAEAGTLRQESAGVPGRDERIIQNAGLSYQERYRLEFDIPVLI